MSRRDCRLCGAPLERTLVDLGMQPLSNAFVSPGEAGGTELFHPLVAYVCDACRLVQVPASRRPEEIFGDYAYFSSFSDSWLRHCEAFAAGATARLGLGPRHRVVEVASNDGYLLQYFRRLGLPVLGIEPAANVAAEAIRRGIPTRVAFLGAALGRELAAAGEGADLLVANNVLAHVPDLNDFVAGLAALLRPGGVLTVEFPHLQRLIEGNEFDTIYHEHFSYFSFFSAERALAGGGLAVFDVDEMPTHGGSLRLWAAPAADRRPEGDAVRALRAREEALGCEQPEGCARFARRVEETRYDVLDFLIRARREGRRVAGYGAPAKGTTLLNYCGIRADLMPFTVDRSPHKQGRLMPGVHIPVFAPERLMEERPDDVLILPWNLRDEVMAQMAGIRAWGGRFVVPIPRLEVLP